MQHQYYLAVDSGPKDTPDYRQDFTFFWAIGVALLMVGVTWGIFQATVNVLNKRVEDEAKELEKLERKIDLNKQATTLEITKSQSDGAIFIKDFINQKFETLSAGFINLEVKREADKNLFLEKLTALEIRLSGKDETVNASRREIEGLKRDIEGLKPAVDHMRQYFGGLDRRHNRKPGDYDT